MAPRLPRNVSAHNKETTPLFSPEIQTDDYYDNICMAVCHSVEERDYC